MNDSARGYKPILTYTLLAVNLLIFGIEFLRGGSENLNTVMQMGALYTPLILERHEWYRLFCPIFLHFGIEHIMANSFSLFAMGQYVEEYYGRIRFMIIYLISGLAGNILTVVVEMYTGAFNVSVGASGAISGLMGAMIIFAIDPEMRRLFPLKRALLAVLFLIIPGFTDPTVNGIAHLGGLIGGFLVAGLMYVIKKPRR